jgi:hypothetical protein
MNEVTSILSTIEAGDPRAAADLFPLVCAELPSDAGLTPASGSIR